MILIIALGTRVGKLKNAILSYSSNFAEQLLPLHPVLHIIILPQFGLAKYFVDFGEIGSTSTTIS